MTTRVVIGTITALMSIALTGCVDHQKGDDVISARQLRQIRQENIDLATELAATIVPRANNVAEDAGSCRDGDESIKQSSYHIGGPPGKDVRDYVFGTWSNRMKKDGWTVRDRDKPGGGFDRGWAKGAQSLNVTLTPNPGKSPLLTIDTNTPCGHAGPLESGVIAPGDPEYLAPRVPGPRMDGA